MWSAGARPPADISGRHPPGPVASAPSDAIVLFDGSSLDEWVNANDGTPSGWMVADGILTVNKGVGDIIAPVNGPEYQGVLAWLLAGDPAIRWQTLRDLVNAPAEQVATERGRVAVEGWGARLLAEQDAAGRWATGKSAEGGLYSPKWTSTTYTMLLLRDLGLSPSEVRVRPACEVLLDEGLQRDGGINYGWQGRSETCITGMVLSILSYFELDDDRLDTITDHLLAQQMRDGGWNCRRWQGATHSSVHTTISALEGLRLYELLGRARAREAAAAQNRGREFLLRHRLYRSHRTGNVIKSEFKHFHFPPRWHYDVLRALDHFQAVDAPRDPRLRDGIELVLERRHPNGRWFLNRRYNGKTYFKLERLGASSRWNTLRALRVLLWWGDEPTGQSP